MENHKVTHFNGIFLGTLTAGRRKLSPIAYLHAAVLPCSAVSTLSGDRLCNSRHYVIYGIVGLSDYALKSS